jgi:YbbR domain-containing protein
MILQRLRGFVRQLPTLLFAFILAVIIWAIAVNSSDPSVQKTYPDTVAVEVMGQSPDLVLTSALPNSVSIIMRAPTSIWAAMIDEKAPVRATIDLSGLEAGQHTVPMQIEVGIKPVEIVSYNPRSVDVILEPLISNEFDINVVNNTNPAIGYQAGTPHLDVSTATVSGAESLVKEVTEVRATLDLEQATSDINQQISLQAYDSAGKQVKGLAITPEKVTVTESIAQLGGFRNVVVKLTTAGQPATGYRLTGITVNPPTVTVYSAEPKLVEALPGYVNTESINLTGLKDDLNQQIGLRLPDGITVVGDPSVNVQVSVAAVENSLSLSGIPIQATGLPSNLVATISPASADVIIAGPLVTLNSASISDLQILIDLSGLEIGRHTIQPTTTLNNTDLRIESIVPTTFEVTISQKGAATPTATKP